VISVERANVVVPVASWQMVTYHDLRTGHLTLTRFTEGSGDKLRAEVRAAVDAGARGLIAGSQIPRR
jgi:C-terminal processing protease CtpA/Prc